MKKIIFGFVGEIASGKGTACDYLINKYQAGYHRYSTIMRDVAKRLYLEENRDNLQKLSKVLRENFSQDIFAKVIAKDVQNDSHSFICLDGIRRPEDIEYVKKIDNFVLINVHADMKTRYERLINRTENTDDKQKTFEQFQTDHEYETEKTIRIIAAKADEKIDNNGSRKDLEHQIDNLVEKYKN